MKYASLLDSASAHALAFGWLAAAVAPVSESGEGVFARLEPFRPGQEAQARARATWIAEIADAIDASKLEAMRDIIRITPDESEAMSRIAVLLADTAVPALANAHLGEIDVLIAAARFTQQHRCTVAESTRENFVAFAGGRFLPLAAELEAVGRAFAPIDVVLHDVAVLTGPNMGGKSVSLRTCGFIALCAAFGLPVPAERARVGLFDEIAWLGIGSDGDIGGLLSSFAREIVRLREILARDARRLFVLADEFARTTTPHEGKALLVATLERFREREACGMAATHLGGVADEAAARHFAVRGLRNIPQRPESGDLQAALAALGASMDYTIAEVTDGETSRADAIALASLLGLDDSLIARAYEHLGR